MTPPAAIVQLYASGPAALVQFGAGGPAPAVAFAPAAAALAQLLIDGVASVVALDSGRRPAVSLAAPAPAAVVALAGGQSLQVAELSLVGPRGVQGLQGVPGDAADGNTVTGTAAVPLSAGQAATRAFGPASALTAATPCVGLVLADAAAGTGVTLRTAGKLTLADWTAAAGSPYLQAGAPYFASDLTPGRVAVAVPTTPGRVVQCVGRALTADTLVISIQYPVLL